MGKYYLFFKNSISESLAYRSNVFVLLLSQLISLAVFILLWMAIYKEGNTVGSYTLNGLIAYYVASTLFGFAIQEIDVAWRIIDDIRLGNITNFILRPVDYFLSTISIIAGKTAFNLSLAALISVPFAVLWPSRFAELFGNPGRDLIFAASFALAFGIFVSFSYVIGMMSFWLGTSQGLNFMSRMAMLFLSGNLLPLDLLPDWIRSANGFLPFRYMAWIPIRILIGEAEPDWRTLIPGLAWLVVLAFAAKATYKKGIEKYEGFGA